MPTKPQKGSGFSRSQIEKKFKDLGYVGLLKTISPFYEREAEDLKLSFKKKVFKFLLEQKPPVQGVLKESMHYFAGYDHQVSGFLLLVCAYKRHRYGSDIVPVFKERVDSCRLSEEEKKKHSEYFLKDSCSFAKMLFGEIPKNKKVFVFGVDVVGFLDSRILLFEGKKQGEEGIKEIDEVKIPVREKLKNSFQNGIAKFGLKPKTSKTIVRKMVFRRKPKLVHQKIMSA